MLSMGAMSAGQEQYYIGLAKEDYYLEGGEPPGMWLSEGARILGLSGLVDKEVFSQVFSGFAPDGMPLVQNAGATSGTRRRKCGWDLTFSAPKSVSTAWSQADELTRHEIQAAHLEAVEKAIHWLEENGAFTRRGKNGYVLEPCKLVVAAFEHGTSRAQEPQLHTHTLVLNVGIREDGTTGALFSKPFYQNKMLLGALYRAELSYQLEKRLGLQSERVRSWFELKGVSKKLMDNFSTRRKEVEAELAKTGYKSAEAASVAALNSREVKEHCARSDLFSSWRAVGETIGWGYEQLKDAMDVAPERDHERELGGVITGAMKEVTSNQAYFSKEDFLRRCFEEAQGRGVSSEDVLSRALDELRQRRDLVLLGLIEGKERYTTKEMLQIEKELFEAVSNSKNSFGKSVSKEKVDQALVEIEKGKGFKFSNEQREAVSHLVEGGGSIRLVTGKAGAGKTTMMEAAKASWESDGYQVVGATISNRAARVLEEDAGIKSTSIHKLLTDAARSREEWNSEIAKEQYNEWRDERKAKWNRFQAWSVPPKWNDSIERAAKKRFFRDRPKNPLSSKTILVIDEAGMVDTRSMWSLVKEALQVGADIRLVGDGKQLQPVSAGGPIHTVGDILGDKALTENRRQQDSWAREAVDDFAAGRASDGLKKFADRGLLTVEETIEEAKDRILDDFREGGGVTKPEAHMILCNENKDVNDMNRRVQAARLVAGELGNRSAEIKRGRAYLGDRIQFTKNLKSCGVDNGEAGVVNEVKSRGVSVRLDRGKTVLVPFSDLKEHVKLGYALTVYKAQGQTVEYAYVLSGGSMQSRETSYVQMSRAKINTRIYADRQQAGDELTEDSALVRSMGASRAKGTIYDLLKRREEGLHQQM